MRRRNIRSESKLNSNNAGKLVASDPEVTRRTGRNIEVFGDAESIKPKGILTPSRNREGPRARKSVVFEDLKEADLGFKDLPLTSNKKPAAETGTLEAGYQGTSEEDSEEDDEDEIACSICSGLDSKRPNAILLCDGCNLAVHQNCYRVAKVPRGEWFCNACKSKRNDIELNNELEVEDVAVELLEMEGFEEHLRTMQTFLLGRLTGSQHIRLQGHIEEMDKVHQVVKQTVLAGEGNSMLVIGARGSGKTTLIQSIISDLSPHRDNFHLVKLNGFIHTDDKLALKEIWRQLGREMEVEDDNKATANDTLQSLLALLSHPTEISESAEGQTTRSVVFVLDEFDLFTTHPRQTLLYNLFDIAQARKAPIVVLGLTTRVDVVETLEKRVKSRFSHRHVHLSLPRSVPAFWEICKTGLTADTESLQAAGIDVEAQGLKDFLAYWRSMVDDLHMNAAFKHYLESHFYRSKSVSAFFTSCILPLASLSAKNFPLTAKAFTSPSISLLAPDSKLHMLGGLSELELAMLISAARLDIILDTDTCNFAMVYDEYCRLTSRHKIQTSSTGIAALGAGAKVWGREVALGAWERLAQYDILVPAGVGGGSARDLGAGGRMWKVDIGLEEIAGSVDSLSTIMTKWCREI
ncbi:origin recognition complex subunit 4 C-terminus-domain-containing protein [Bisporella sp. PMI_857]|nr:origin recognition complex subunit 4 C-terminus-domain-containing protein [Bisporella sp. PMI_857]